MATGFTFTYYNYRKRYAKSLQISHSYGSDDEEEEGSMEEATALELTESAIAGGNAPKPNIPADEIRLPQGAEIDIGGPRKCKWCKSSTHQRKSHKDCPYNKDNSV